MKQLYAIRAFGGSYEDAWERTEYVTDDLVKGEAYCAEMNAFRDEVITAKKKCQEFSQQWIAQNPRLPHPEPKQIVVPRWDSKTKVTQEMRDERKRLEEINTNARMVAYEPMRQWGLDYNAAMKAFDATFSAEIQEGLQKNCDDTYWDIEPVEWLE
jgi:hypothetical protein